MLTQLQRMKLDQSPFLVVSVVGQVLLEAGSFKASVTVLESALRIGTCSQKLKGSVFSALSNAHWATGHIDRAIACMQQDLAVARALGKMLASLVSFPRMLYSQWLEKLWFICCACM